MSKESSGVPMYSPGRRRKKWPSVSNEATARATGVASCRASATVLARRVPGRGLTRDGGSSYLLHEWNKDVSRRSNVPWAFSRGSTDPNPAYVWPTARTASSTVRDRTARRPGAMLPSRTRCAKSWRSGMASRGRP